MLDSDKHPHFKGVDRVATHLLSYFDTAIFSLFNFSILTKLRQLEKEHDVCRITLVSEGRMSIIRYHYLAQESM